MGERFDTLQAVWGSAKADFSRIYNDGGLWPALRVGGIGVGALVYQVGGAEATIAGAGLYALNATPNSYAAVATTAVAAGVASLGLEGGLAAGMTYTVQKMPQTLRTWALRRGIEASEPEEQLPRSEDRINRSANVVSIAVMGGSPGIVIASAMREPYADAAVHRKRGMQTAWGFAAGNATLGGLVAGGAGFDIGPAEWLANHASDPKLYLGIVGVLQGCRLGKRYVIQPLVRSLRSDEAAT
jgi:hypothetical protein